jgi:hypothetical protein
MNSIKMPTPPYQIAVGAVPAHGWPKCVVAQAGRLGAARMPAALAGHEYEYAPIATAARYAPQSLVNDNKISVDFIEEKIESNLPPESSHSTQQRKRRAQSLISFSRTLTGSRYRTSTSTKKSLR